MDAEALRKEITEKFNWTFNHKCCRTSGGRKTMPEEALDSASERWARLNGANS